MIRHTESPYKTGQERDRGLSASGQADAERIAQLLEQEGITRIVSSPYARAMETVAPLASKLRLDIEPIEELKERPIGRLDIDYGPDVFMDAVRYSFDDPDYTLDGGESIREAGERAMPIIRKLLAEHDGGKLAIGTHGNIMTIIMNQFDSRFDFAFWESTSKPDIYKLEFKESALINVMRLWP